jgi:uncharacterized protein
MYSHTEVKEKIMDFDWNNLPFNLDRSLSLQLIEESFEDPFAVRLLPDSPRFAVQARFFNLGMSAGGVGVFTVFRTNGKMTQVIYARPFEKEEQFFYQRRLERALSQ